MPSRRSKIKRTHTSGHCTLSLLTLYHSFCQCIKLGSFSLPPQDVEVIPQQVYIRICPCRLRYSFGQIPTCHGISGFRFEARAGEKKFSVGDAHRVFLRVVEIQRRKVRQYSKICVTLLFKTSKLSESEIPVQFVYPDSVFESPPICPRTLPSCKTVVVVDSSGGDGLSFLAFLNLCFLRLFFELTRPFDWHC